MYDSTTFQVVIIVESIFAWPGMGPVLLAAISGRDLPVICGYVLMTGLLVIGAHVLSDAVAVVFNPRLARQP